MFRLIFRLLKLKLVQQELRDRWDAGDRVGLVVRPARCPRRTRVGKLSIWLRVGSCVQAARRLRSAVGAYASRSGYVCGAAPGGATDPVHFALQNTGSREWI